LGFVIPVCYTLFELAETVFVGIPDMRLAAEKWEVDFRPTIEASFPEQMPTRGEGSRGGGIKSAVTFTCGARLKFMSAGQGDAGLAGPTTRNLVMTEVDKYDEPGETSREADPIRQMEARTNAFRDFGRMILLECTVSIPGGRIWQEITNGTDSRLYHPCPHCGYWTTWEREHLIGWQNGADQYAAGDGARWECPACSGTFGDRGRKQAMQQTMLVHRGQEVTPDGEITGAEPRTETFGLQWSAFDNPFVSTSRLGQDEWLTAGDINQESAERAARQFVWAIPHEAPDVDLTHLDPTLVSDRQHHTKRGEVPAGTLGLAVGADTGKRRLHWSTHAVQADGSDVIIEYGEQQTEWEALGVTRALMTALERLATYWGAGWLDATGRTWKPAQVWIDSGYAEHQEGVYAFCRASGHNVYRPTKGHGGGVYGGGAGYLAPRQKSESIRLIGRGYHGTWQTKRGILLIHVDADAWKADFQSRLKMPATEAGAIRLYQVADPAEHADWSAQVTAERQVHLWKAGKRAAVKWEQIRRANHWLDAGYLGTAAACYLREHGIKAKGPEGGWFERQTSKRR
jgi:phage terminase large subunit GpA-like protein